MFKNNLYFELTKSCNLNCSYCYLPAEGRAQKVENEALIYESCELLTDKLSKEEIEIDNIILHGAETFVLKPETIRGVVSRLKPLHKVRVQTNGVALTPEYLDALGDLSDKLTIGFSIDAKSVHDKYRGGSYNTVFSHLLDVKARGYTCSILSVVSGETIKYLDELAEMLNKADSLGIKAVIKLAHGDGFSLSPHNQYLLAKWGMLTGHWRKMQSFNYGYCIHGGCSSNVISEFSAVGGDVFVCNKTNIPNGSVGNWKDESLKSVFEKRDKVFDNVAVCADCAECPFWGVCFGGCPNDRDSDGRANDCYLKHHVYFFLAHKGVYYADAFFRNVGMEK